jgi:chorismate mutase
MAEMQQDIPPALERCRAELDQLDEQLIQLLKRRLELGLRAATIKRDAHLPIIDADREAKVMAQARAWADEAGLVEDEVAEIFSRLISLSGRAQLKSV